MAVQFKDGKVLFVDGKVAMDPDCCCCPDETALCHGTDKLSDISEIAVTISGTTSDEICPTDDLPFCQGECTQANGEHVLDSGSYSLGIPCSGYKDISYCANCTVGGLHPAIRAQVKKIGSEWFWEAQLQAQFLPDGGSVIPNDVCKVIDIYRSPPLEELASCGIFRSDGIFTLTRVSHTTDLAGSCCSFPSTITLSATL